MEIKKQIQELAQKIEKALDFYIEQRYCEQEEVLSAMRYSLLGGGKRVRGIFVLEFASQWGCTIEQALPFAAALEMIHSYSMIHDDLPCMDNDDFRRGKPSCHIQYSESMALLAGDGLLTHAFYVMSAYGTEQVGADKTVQAIRVLARAAGEQGMLGGQVLDLKWEGTHPTPQQLKKMYLMKTGALIQAACEIGCIMGGAGQKERQIVRQYGEWVGLAFQITDDILDCTSTQEILGKPIGSDLRQKKYTYAMALGIEEAQKAAEEYTDQALSCLKQLPFQSDFLSAFTKMLAARNS